MSEVRAEKDVVDVAILIALRDEFRVLKDHVGSGDWRKVQADSHAGYFYRFSAPGGDRGAYECVVLLIGDMGEIEATQASGQLLDWKPATIVSLGVAGALSKDLKLGDVAVADHVDAYATKSKAVADGDDGWRFEFGGSVYRSTATLVDAAFNLEFAHKEAYDGWRTVCAKKLNDLFRADEREASKNLLRQYPELHKVHLASGPTVGESQAFASWLQTRNRNLSVLEMEAAGMMLAAHKRPEPVSTLVLRGISDRVDEQNAKLGSIGEGSLRTYAMGNAVRFLWALMEAGLLPRKPTVFPRWMLLTLFGLLIISTLWFHNLDDKDSPELTANLIAGDSTKTHRPTSSGAKEKGIEVDSDTNATRESTSSETESGRSETDTATEREPTSSAAIFEGSETDDLTGDDGDLEGGGIVPRCPPGMNFIHGADSYKGEEIPDFCLDVTEVTVAAFRGNMDKASFEKTKTSDPERAKSPAPDDHNKFDDYCNAQYKDRDDHPINCVDWQQANNYCWKLKRRLPTKLEWEWAARGGRHGSKYSWGDAPPEPKRVNACFEECAEEFEDYSWEPLSSGDDGCKTTCSVVNVPKSRSQDRLLHMSGNVWEWTSSKTTNGGRTEMVQCGGSWKSASADELVAECRGTHTPDSRGNSFGFRCALGWPTSDGN